MKHLCVKQKWFYFSWFTLHKKYNEKKRKKMKINEKERKKEHYLFKFC